MLPGAGSAFIHSLEELPFGHDCGSGACAFNAVLLVASLRLNRPVWKCLQKPVRGWSGFYAPCRKGLFCSRYWRAVVYSLSRILSFIFHLLCKPPTFLPLIFYQKSDSLSACHGGPLPSHYNWSLVYLGDKEIAQQCQLYFTTESPGAMHLNS